ncbi:hypothetical protein Tco_0040958 [Tanacetum coccineum]
MSAEEVNTAEGVNTGSIKLSTVSEQVSTVSAKRSTPSPDKGQKSKEKLHMIIERKAQVQFEAQHLQDEELGFELEPKIEANAELGLSKSILGKERARAKRIKPMTQSQLKTYMMNYLKNQGTWKLSQLKNLSFEEVKKEFDKLVKQVESFAPVNLEATKASLKRFGEELQTKTSKRLKSDEAKDVESTKKSGKRRKHEGKEKGFCH